MSKHTVIVFPHPGDEHSCDSNEQHIKEWNTTNHRRKFLSADGEYIDGDVYVPNGEAKVNQKNCLCNDHAEFIVYDVDQIKLRYLLKIRYN